MDMDPYLQIIKYLWKARNDKLFRRIDRDPLELIRSGKGECRAQFSENEFVPSTPQTSRNSGSQAIYLENICLVDGSWSSTFQFSGCGWIQEDTSRNNQLIGKQNSKRRKSVLYSVLEALTWAMENMLNVSTYHNFVTDCMDMINMIRKPEGGPNFSTELKEIRTLQLRFQDFKICHIIRRQNGVSSLLARTAKSFYREFEFISCFFPIWLPRRTQA